MSKKVYACIDLKSFYASVECVERGLDPMTTNLVVADNSRTEKTICLAVSPSLKSYGIGGRARLYEVVQKVNKINRDRKNKIKGSRFIKSSYSDIELKNNPRLKLNYIVAPPRMAYYMDYSTKIYNIYLKYLAPEDIYAYSVDEVFCDLTNYLSYYKMSARELVTKMIHDVYETTGITATAGIGTNMYLCKVAMDIVAKHMQPDKFGVRIAGLDEYTYRKLLWGHKPITDFWRVGAGYAKRLSDNNMYTMGDVCRCSIDNEELLYKLFGVNAELLIDHAWGYESCTIEDVKSYKPSTNSISSGQVLQEPYDFGKAKLIVREMTELLVLELVSKKLVTNQMVLTIEYDVTNLTNSKIRDSYNGDVTEDRYGRKMPKHAHGSINLGRRTSSTKFIVDSVIKLYGDIVNRKLLIRKIYVVANNVVNEDKAKNEVNYEQLNLFDNYKEVSQKKKEEEEYLEKEKKIQKSMLDIKKKFGKNAILKGMNLKDGGTTIERNKMIGGHKA